MIEQSAGYASNCSLARFENSGLKNAVKEKGQHMLTLFFVALFLIFVNNPSHELSVNKQKFETYTRGTELRP